MAEIADEFLCFAATDFFTDNFMLLIYCNKQYERKRVAIFFQNCNQRITFKKTTKFFWDFIQEIY